MTKRELSRGLGVPLSLDFKDAPRDAMTLITVSDGMKERSLLISQNGMVEIDADKYLQAPKERLRAKEDDFRTFAKLTFKSSGWIAASMLLSFVVLTFSGLVSAKVVLTDSMVPTIKPGDVVLELSPERLKPHQGSILTYVGKTIDGEAVAPFTHRVVGGNLKDGFIMQGDANKDPDVQRPKMEDIEGVVFLTIPKVGSLLTPKMLMMFLLAGFGLWLIVDAFREED